MTSQNSQGMGYDADVSFTLNAIDRHGVAADLYNHSLTGDITATLNASSCETATHSGPSVIEPNRGGCLGLDHVMLSGGTTYQGRGYYEDVSGCMKTMQHGVMTDEEDNNPE